MSRWIRFRDATLTLLRLLPMIWPLTVRVFAFRVGCTRWRTGAGSAALRGNAAGSRGSSTSRMVGIGVLRLVCRWWTRGVVQTTLGDVASVELVAGAAATLGGAASPTLGAGALLIMVVSSSMILAWAIFCCAAGGVPFFMALRRSFAARRVRSASEMVGTEQWAGYNVRDPVMRKLRVVGTQNTSFLKWSIEGRT